MHELSHLLGTCGEPHPSLLMSIPVLGYIIYKVKQYFQIIKGFKNEPNGLCRNNRK